MEIFQKVFCFGIKNKKKNACNQKRKELKKL